MPVKCFLESLKEEVCKTIPFKFSSNSNKPSHVANNLFRCCLGKKSKISELYDWLYISNKKNASKPSDELLEKYKKCFAVNTSVSDVKKFRSMLMEVFNQDNTMYPTEAFSCPASTSIFTVKGAVAAEQGLGDYIFSILKCKISGKESPAINLIIEALKSKNNPFATIILPLCGDLKQDQIDDPYYEGKTDLAPLELVIRNSFDCLANNMIKMNMNNNPILVLQRMVSLTVFSILFYFINLNHLNCENLTPMVFDSGVNLNSIIRCSHDCFVNSKKEIEKYFTSLIYDELCKGLSNTNDDCLKKISDMPLEDDSANTKRNAIKRLYESKISGDGDYLKNLADALQEALYTYEFKDCTPSEFLSTCLGVRNGIIGPKGNNAIKRFYPSKFILENIILSSVCYEDLVEGIEYVDFGSILREKYNIILGINNDLECKILEENGLKNTPGDILGDLHKNSINFAEIIISLGYGKIYADGVTMIGCDL